MKFARTVFLVAGVYGLIVITPLFFSERSIATQFPPAITHPEHFYGFLGVAFSFQIVFLILSRDPIRYRPMMIPSMLEKFIYGAAAVVLFLQQRIPGVVFAFAVIDILLGFLFVVSYVKTQHE